MVGAIMPRVVAVLAALGLAAAALPASAGETPCWVDKGAVVVSAALGDIAGDFLLDLSAPRSVLHVDRALTSGIETPTDAATLTLAGERIPASFAVASLDARSLGLPTTINGLIGADVLAGYVIDLRLAPCRLALWRRRAPPIGPAQSLPVAWVAGVPTIAASITDGRLGMAGRFGVDTGSAGVRIATAAARLSRTPKGIDAASRQRPPARLAALGLGGGVIRDAPAGLASDAPAGVLGDIGDDVWARYDLRLDLRAGRLQLAQPMKPPSGRRRARSAGS
jgi:hypothetical protein